MAAVCRIGPMEKLVNLVNPYDFTQRWIYSEHRCPNAVITLIGPNDFLAGYKPDSVKFTSAYQRLLKMQIENYAKCSSKPALILVCTQ